MDDIMTHLQKIESWQGIHEAKDDVRFDKIGTTLTDIKENHLAHIQTAIEKQATDAWWIKTIAVGIATGIGGLFVTLVGAILLKWL